MLPIKCKEKVATSRITTCGLFIVLWIKHWPPIGLLVSLLRPVYTEHTDSISVSDLPSDFIGFIVICRNCLHCFSVRVRVRLPFRYDWVSDPFYLPISDRLICGKTGFGSFKLLCLYIFPFIINKCRLLFAKYAGFE